MGNIRVKKAIGRLTLAVAAIAAILVCFKVYLPAEAYEEREAYVSSDGDNVNVRSGPGTSYGKVISLAHGTRVIIIGEEYASDGSLWYQVRFTVNGGTQTGYMHSAYLMYTDYSGLDEVEKRTFEELLAEFPESYKENLLILHDMYPSWKFVAVNTGLEWSDALAAESSNCRSLVSTGAISSWKSLEGDSYDWNTSTWKARDGASWVEASKEIVAYYLDPRNYLDGSLVFAFLTHGYDSESQTVDGVRSVIGSSFMAVDFEEDGTRYAYADVLMEAGRLYSVSPYVLAAMIRLEIGYDGNSASISGIEPGFEGLYNYYNVGAYAITGMTANQRGLWYAAGAGTGDTSYSRPWDTRYKALLGGAEFYASNYVARGQNTLYLKKFNLTENNTYEHQYMTNIQGAASEANLYSLAYNAAAKMQPLIFYIPVYNNMPETACAKPTKYGSPNNKLDSITLNGTVFEGFHMDTASYYMEVSADVDKVTLAATPKDGTASISGTGEVSLAVGENTFTISCTAQNGDVRNYTVTILRAVSSDTGLSALTVSAGTLMPGFSSDVYEYTVILPADQSTLTVSAAARDNQAAVEVIGGGEMPTGESVVTVKVTAGDGVSAAEYHITVERPVPNQEVTLSSEVYSINENKTITGVTAFPVTAADFQAGLTVTNGTAELVSPDGSLLTGNVGTGTMVKIYDASGILCDIYTVVIYGDVNGDGIIGDVDFLRILKHVMDYSRLTGISAEAADINHNGMVDDIDFLRILKYVMGYANNGIVQ